MDSIDILPKTSEMENIVNSLKTKYIELWWQTSEEFPTFENKHSNWSRFIKKRQCNKFIDRVITHIKAYHDKGGQDNNLRHQIRDMVREFIVNSLGVQEDYLELPFEEGFIKVTKEFLDRVKAFNPNMEPQDVFQAIRNVWIMNSIQIFLAKEITHSPSIFAYSMLYPYTDNYIDNPEVDIKEKLDFSKHFRGFLSGEIDTPVNQYEGEILKLVKMFEEQYCRTQYPSVYQSLLTIHDAQQKSLLQQRGKASPYQRDILGISFEKGGTSVLTDGYLVAGRLNENQANFMFGYGILLQLVDDLRDIKTDLKNGHMTIFSQTAGKWPLDSIANKLFNFTLELLEGLDTLGDDNLEKFKQVIKANCTLLIFEGVAHNKNLFSPAYIKEIQQYIQFPLTYLPKINKRLQREYGLLKQSGIDLAKIIDY